MRTKRSFVAVLAACTMLAAGSDWPQFRGPRRDGVSLETNLRKEWPQDGPPLLWTFGTAGIGYAGPAIVGDRLYTCGARGDSEYVYALELGNNGQSVKEVWATRIGPLFTWKGNNWNAGPSATPTVDGELLYALGGHGDLVCVQIADGKERWRKSMPRDFAGEVNPIGGGLEDPTPLGWGYTWAPLVDGPQLVCVPGGKEGLLAALDKTTGNVLWRSKEVTDQASYSSPIVVDIAGIRQYVQVTNNGMSGVAARDGKKLWSYHREPAYQDVVIATPVFQDGYLFSSVGFDQGCDLIKPILRDQQWAVETVYSNRMIENRDGGVILVDGYLYGYSENKGWFCAEFKTGKIAWSSRKLGRGSLTYADGNLYCCTEQGGIVALVGATHKGWQEKGRLKLPNESTLRRPSGGLWTHPVIANGRLYLRDQELIYCYDLRP